MGIALLLVVLLVLILGSAATLTLSRRRARGPELEPPPRRPEGAGTTTLAEPPGTAPAPELTPEQVAEIEAALTGVATPPAPPVQEAPPAPPAPPAPAVPEAPPAPARIRDRLGQARTLLAGYVGALRARDRIDDDAWDELEEALIRADVGVETTASLLDGLRRRVKAGAIATTAELVDALKADLEELLGRGDRSLRFEPGGPNVWLFVGVNGVGKTTTIGKIGLRAAGEGRRVIMAAGDTFRAAAADQLGMWADRVGSEMVRGAEGGDPGAVVFDAVQRAAARGVDLVLADTAGRLHTKVNLMEELKKVRRIAERPPARLSEVLLVLDATTGQNGLIQAKEFLAAAGVTGVVLTKLDGTAKGGIALAIASELGLPIKLVGLGEGASDLVDFDPHEFVEALFEP